MVDNDAIACMLLFNDCRPLPCNIFAASFSLRAYFRLLLARSSPYVCSLYRSFLFLFFLYVCVWSMVVDSLEFYAKRILVL